VEYRFQLSELITELDSVVAIIDPEMNQQAIRWGGTYSEWQANVQQLRDFINLRCDALTTGFIDCYPLTGPYSLVVNSNPSTAGPVKVNSIMIDQFPWTGTYYGGIDTRFKAMPDPAFSFDHWTSDHHTFFPGSNSDSVITDLTANDTVTAYYNTSSIHTIRTSSISVTIYPNIFSESFYNRLFTSLRNTRINEIANTGRQGCLINIHDRSGYDTRPAHFER